MKKIWMVIALMSLQCFGNEKLILTVGTDSLSAIKAQVSVDLEILKQGDEISLIRLDKEKMFKLSELMHHDFGRCPGFTKYFSEAEAYEDLASLQIKSSVQGLFTLDYKIDQHLLVKPLVEQIDEVSTVQIIAQLSNYPTRYHKSKTGLEAVMWLKSHWESLGQGRSDVTVELVKHRDTPQPSVILTIEGTENPEQVIVVGGHVDSIARGFFGGISKIAPGADDNASGIATMTEVIRVLMSNSYRSNKTIKFMAYAAEEIGLVGSREIAKSFKKAGTQVVGVMQLDMTNFKGSDEDIVLMTDYTNKAQNTFITSIIDTYVKVKWGTDKCGYACSDHASWTNAGFPASMPFESKVKDMNRKIHSKKDTLAVSKNHAFHAIKFAKMAIAYVVELDR